MLEVSGLRVCYGAVTGVRNMSFTIEPGQLMAVLGPNGAGKTSMLEALAGRLRSEGTIRLDGRDINSLTTTQRVRRGLALVPQGREILNELSVDDNLNLAATILGRRAAARARAAAYDTMPILAPLARRKAGYLSGGEQQSLAIARAVISSPSVLLLDEPSFGLSPALRSRILEWVATQRDERGIAVILAEQFTDLALRHAHTVLTLSHGDTLWTGPVHDVTPSIIEDAYFS